MKVIDEFLEGIEVAESTSKSNLFEVTFPYPINAVACFDMGDFPEMDREEFIEWLIAVIREAMMCDAEKLNYQE